MAEQPSDAQATGVKPSRSTTARARPVPERHRWLPDAWPEPLLVDASSISGYTKGARKPLLELKLQIWNQQAHDLLRDPQIREELRLRLLMSRRMVEKIFASSTSARPVFLTLGVRRPKLRNQEANRIALARALSKVDSVLWDLSIDNHGLHETITLDKRIHGIELNSDDYYYSALQSALEQVRDAAEDSDELERTLRAQLADIEAEKRRIASLEFNVVQAVHDAGLSWRRIGDSLGISGPSAYRKYDPKGRDYQRAQNERYAQERKGRAESDDE